MVQIKTVQTDLTTVKCFSGALDGVIGPVTRAGIAAFQQADSLTVNSQFGPETKTKLMAAAQAGESRALGRAGLSQHGGGAAAANDD